MTLNHETTYASYLRELYVSMSHSHTSQHWTNLPRCEFVQLAMISSGGQRRGGREEEMIKLSQQGRIETILRHKEPIDLENLFQTQPLVVLPPPPHARVILIEGIPGGGKSTFALYICHKWAQDASFLARFDLAVLIYLRDRAIHNATSLADILPDTLEVSNTVTARLLQATRGHSVLFVFDGWDEFPSHLQDDSIVSTIIRQQLSITGCFSRLSLHHSTVPI